MVKTGVKEAVCSVCEKELEDGVSITAKTIRGKINFFCQYHFPVDFWIFKGIYFNGLVMAPSDAEPTSDAYFANAPVS